MSASVEMREIEAFLAVAEELHFGRAAERLYLTTSHVSHTIRRLEDRVGAPLFARTSRRVVLTPLGERLYAGLRPPYDAIGAVFRDAREAARRAATAGTLRIALAGTAAADLPDRLFTDFAQRHPGCHAVTTTLTLRMQRALLTGARRLGTETDAFIAWTALPPDGAATPHLTFGPELARAPRALLLPDDHPLAGRSAIDIEDLAAGDHPVFWNADTAPRQAAFLEEWTPSHTPAGRPLRRVASTIDYTDELRDRLIEQGLVHLTVRTAALPVFPGLRLVPLTGLPPARLVLFLPADPHEPLRLFVHSATLTASGN